MIKISDKEKWTLQDVIHDLLVVSVIVASIITFGYLFWNGLDDSFLYVGKVINTIF